MMWRPLTSFLYLPIVLTSVTPVHAAPRQERTRRVIESQEKNRPPSVAPTRGLCPAPIVKLTGEQTEPLRFVRVEGCEVVWRNVYNDPAIPDLRLKYTGVNPIPADTPSSTVFMVTRTIKDRYLVTARLENGSYSRWKPPFPLKPSPTPAPKPVPPPAPPPKPTAAPKPTRTPQKKGWSLPDVKPEQRW